MKRRNFPCRFIWQTPGWPNFTWDSDRLIEPLAKVSNLQGVLNGRMSLIGINKQSETIINALTDEMVSSSEIEGVYINPASVKSSIAKKLGIEQDGLLVEDHYVEGMVDVMMDALTNCFQPLSTDRLFGWHSALFPTGRSGMYKIKVGGWRTGQEPMQVVSGALGRQRVHFEAPPSEEVPAMMDALMEWCDNREISPFIMAAVAHFWFLTIHPFDDGNGRISRILADMLLARNDDGFARYYSMSAEINRNKKEYYEVLERSQKGGLDITDWIVWFLNSMEKAILATHRKVDRVLKKAAFWDKHAENDINERQRKILNRLWDGFEGKLTSTKYAKICHCSQDTAIRDIKKLVELGMLENSPEEGRSKHYLLPECF